jgi:type II secretory pathway pseudopilin PulG
MRTLWENPGLGPPISMRTLLSPRGLLLRRRSTAPWPPRAGQQGYMLLAVMLLITLMLVALSIELPRIVQQIKREKEEELVHRGKEYAIAVKKFYHKNGTYPVSLEQLESTNNLRFLRQRYKDPMTPDGEWKLVHVGEAQINLPAQGMPGATGQMGTVNTSAPGASPTPSPSPGGLGGATGLGGTTGLSGGNQPGAGGKLGTLSTQNIGTGPGANAQGGGQIIGVVSTSKKTSIKEFNGSSEYDEWLFVYDPRLEQVPGGGGVIIAAPRVGGAPTTGGPAATTQAAPGSPSPAPIATPAASPGIPQ